MLLISKVLLAQFELSKSCHIYYTLGCYDFNDMRFTYLTNSTNLGPFSVEKKEAFVFLFNSLFEFQFI